MSLANRVLLCALVIFVLSAVASAQTLRLENDPRNQSPSVGTGGPEGGPTGLFTIYDGSTLRKGEFTFSISYSNYDRDPGNVDITDWIASVNIGLNDHIELFFKTQAYRGIKVNTPTNLSGFYLPNSQVYFGSGLLGSAPAIVLAPSGPNVGTLAGSAVFRPPFCPNCVASTNVLSVFYTSGQPFVQYPYTGGAGPNFGLTSGRAQFGFPGFSATLGPPTTTGNSFGRADVFPGVGSPVGSILPGVVLATTIMPCTALTGGCQPPASPGPLDPIVVPTFFTVAPSYLPDAPFVSRLYGESSFGNFVAGAKIRLTSPKNPFGFGFIPFYRWYADKPGSTSGFNQLQRGASPGGNIGDFGLVAFVDGRLSRSVNLSANLGYILNSNPKDGSSTLLDRPDELIAGVGFDFPINKHFQPIMELRSTQYVAGRTPNVFPNNPVEFLAGVKIYPKRWYGLGVWYRRHLNQQDLGHFNGTDSNTAIQQITGVNVPGRGIIIVPGTSVAATSGGFPLGFIPSSDPNGFGFQFWAGRRNAREPAILPNQPPVISAFAASASTITLPCPPGTTSSTCPAAANTTLGLTTTASDPDGDTLLYSYTVTGGRITGEGANVSWDLSGVGPGTYTASVEVDDGCGCITSSSTTVTVANCPDCVAPPQPTPMPTPEPTPPPAPEKRKFDEYGNIRFNDEKARLDNFAVQLQNEPGAQGYIVAYGTCDAEGQKRGNRAKDYMVNTRGIDAGRLVVVDGGCMPQLKVELWIVPSGASPATADTAGAVSPCPDCKKKTTRRRGGRRHEE